MSEEKNKKDVGQDWGAVVDAMELTDDAIERNRQRQKQAEQSTGTTPSQPDADPAPGS